MSKEKRGYILIVVLLLLAILFKDNIKNMVIGSTPKSSEDSVGTTVENDKEIKDVDLSKNDITLELPTMPTEVSAFTYSGEVSLTYKITDITYESEYNLALGEYATYIYISGEKTYDKDGNSSNENRSIHWKIYDVEDSSIIIDSGTYLPPDMCVGEKFLEERIATYDLEKGKSYKLEFYDE